MKKTKGKRTAAGLAAEQAFWEKRKEATKTKTNTSLYILAAIAVVLIIAFPMVALGVLVVVAFMALVVVWCLADSVGRTHRRRPRRGF